MTGVPIVGLPGVKVKVRPGARVVIDFARGEPDAPRATFFEPDSLAELTITADTTVRLDAPHTELCAGASRGIAREGDMLLLTGWTVGPPPVPVTAIARIEAGSSEVFA